MTDFSITAQQPDNKTPVIKNNFSPASKRLTNATNTDPRMIQISAVTSKKKIRG